MKKIFLFLLTILFVVCCSSQIRTPNYWKLVVSGDSVYIVPVNSSWVISTAKGAVGDTTFVFSINGGTLTGDSLRISGGWGTLITQNGNVVTFKPDTGALVTEWDRIVLVDTNTTQRVNLTTLFAANSAKTDSLASHLAWISHILDSIANHRTVLDNKVSTLFEIVAGAGLTGGGIMDTGSVDLNISDIDSFMIGAGKVSLNNIDQKYVVMSPTLTTYGEFTYPGKITVTQNGMISSIESGTGGGSSSDTTESGVFQFITTAESIKVYIPGILTGDKFAANPVMTTRNESWNVNDFMKTYTWTDTLLIRRGAAGTSGLKGVYRFAAFGDAPPPETDSACYWVEARYEGGSTGDTVDSPNDQSANNYIATTTNNKYRMVLASEDNGYLSYRATGRTDTNYYVIDDLAQYFNASTKDWTVVSVIRIDSIYHGTGSAQSTNYWSAGENGGAGDIKGYWYFSSTVESKRARITNGNGYNKTITKSTGMPDPTIFHLYTYTYNDAEDSLKLYIDDVFAGGTVVTDTMWASTPNAFIVNKFVLGAGWYSTLVSPAPSHIQMFGVFPMTLSATDRTGIYTRMKSIYTLP